MAVDQLRSDDDCVHRFLIVNATQVSEVGEPKGEWDVIRIDLLRNGQWTFTAIECGVSRTSTRDRKARNKLEVLRDALQGGYSDLAWYRPWLASPGKDRPVYEDAGCSYTTIVS